MTSDQKHGGFGKNWFDLGPLWTTKHACCADYCNVSERRRNRWRNHCFLAWWTATTVPNRLGKLWMCD